MAGRREGYGIGWLRGDASQMPGAFVVAGGRVVAQFIHETAADRPDYVDLADEGVDEFEYPASRRRRRRLQGAAPRAAHLGRSRRPLSPRASEP